MLRAATIGDSAFISRVVITSWQDAYRDFLPSSFLASLGRSPYHDARCWEHRISEPGSVTWIISDDDSDVGVLRMIGGGSSIPDTDAPPSICCRKRAGTGLALRLSFSRGLKCRVKLRAL